MRDTQNTGIAQAKARTNYQNNTKTLLMPLKMLNRQRHKHRQRMKRIPPESEEALAQATDARLKANNQFTQYDAAFKQTFTEQEQKTF